ncbi:GntR family transcriptional regulator [Sphingomonas flavalba]|uniref:GntR family transcriptional regulator n=1 Tax=Sphingomonas flavalba TaxID=2559804 RepID=UPI00109DEE9C|nr:GntR family transcriptional regulator [Sphingomonas flavalba]
MSGDPLGLAETVATRLREEITGGGLPPGTRLAEVRLTRDLGVSRNTLREAFRLLSRDGLLRHEPHRGMFVAAPSMAAIIDIYRVRRLIEIPAVTQAWPRHDAVARMRTAVDEATAARAAGDWRSVGSANMAFHAAIVALTDSPRLAAFYVRIAAELRLAFGLLDSAERLHAPYVEDNETIVRLLEQGDPAGAAARLTTYLDQSERVVLDAFARLADDQAPAVSPTGPALQRTGIFR